MLIGQTVLSMSGLTEVQVQRCLQITRRMNDLPIAIYFRDPVDPERDSVPDYHEKVKRPMDISTIIRNLEERRYTSIEKWKDDIEQIRKNCEIYHGPQKDLTVLAKELVDFAKKKWEGGIPKTDWDMWAYRVAKTQRKLEMILEAWPDPSAPPAKVPKLKLKLRA